MTATRTRKALAATAALVLLGTGWTARAATDPERASAPTTADDPAPPSHDEPPSATPRAQPRRQQPHGRESDRVERLQRRLLELHYEAGRVDGLFGPRTAAAVLTFQKIEELPRTGRVDAAVTARLANARPPRPLMPDREPTRVEVDLQRQILLHWVDGRLHHVLPVSTGSDARYCVARECSRAVTPVGSFRITRKIPAMRRSRLGALYFPMYFSGGIAIHGAPSVPPYPASHGCVRVPMWAAANLYRAIDVGTAVYVTPGPGVSGATRSAAAGTDSHPTGRAGGGDSGSPIVVDDAWR